MGFPILPFFLIFLIWLTFRIKSLDAKQEKQQKDFWDRERAANITPAKDISNLRYITIPIEKFPLNFTDDPKVLEIENELQELSTHKLLNLTGKSNTDLKLEYGVPNFETMTKIGEDFDRLCVLLNSYAKILKEAGLHKDALETLEFAVGIGSDINETYTLLADYYKENSQKKKHQYIKSKVSSREMLLKDSILKKIDPYNSLA